MKTKAIPLFLLLLVLLPLLAISPAKATTTQNICVNAYDGTLLDSAGWTNTGTTPYLDIADTTSYSAITGTSSHNNKRDGLWTCNSTTFTTITSVVLYVYDKSSAFAGNNGFSVYNGTDSGTLLNTFYPAWTSYQWETYTVTSTYNTAAKINKATFSLKFVRVDTAADYCSAIYLLVTGSSGNTYTYIQHLTLTENTHQATTSTLKNSEHVTYSDNLHSKNTDATKSTEHLTLTINVHSTNLDLIKSIQHATTALTAHSISITTIHETTQIQLSLNIHETTTTIIQYITHGNWNWLLNTELATRLTNIQILNITADENQINIIGMENGQAINITIQNQAQTPQITATYPIVETNGGILSPIITPEIEASFLSVPYCQLTLTGWIQDSLSVTANFQIKNKQAISTAGNLTATITRMNTTETLSTKTTPFTIARNNQTIMALTMHVPRSWSTFTEQYYFHITLEYDGKRTSEALAYFKPQLELSFYGEIAFYSIVGFLLIYVIVWVLTNLVIKKAKKIEK